jgi:hypothetical protein
MTNHVKPTIDELKANQETILKELETLTPKLEEVKQEEAPTEKVEAEVEVEEKEAEKVVVPEKKIEEKEVKKTDEQLKEEEDQAFKKKFANSTREAQILAAQNKKMAEALERASDVAEPTDEELVKEYPGWEDMTDFEKKMAKKDMINDRRFTAINEVSKEFKDFDKWKVKVDEFITDPNTLISNPLLEGKEEEFKLFTMKENRQGVDFDTLVSAFLYSAEKERPKHTGKMFETGSGGPKVTPKPKSDKISLEQAALLRKTDYPRYKEMVKNNKIETLE